MQQAKRTQNKILIVDDDMILASIYRKKFQDAKFIVDVAGSGQAAILKISQDVPDVILLDLMLGDMNGVEILEALRMNDVTRKLPVVVFSNVFLGDLMDQAARAGATKCLSKSGCPPYRVIDEVQNALLRGNGAAATTIAPVASSPLSVPPAPPAREHRAPAANGSRAAVAPAAAPAAAPIASAAEEDVPENVRRDLHEQILRRIEEVERTLPKWVTHAHNPDAPYLPALYRSIRSIGQRRPGRLSATRPDGRGARGPVQGHEGDTRERDAVAAPHGIASDRMPARARPADRLVAHRRVRGTAGARGGIEPGWYTGLCSALEAAHLRAVGLDDAYMAWKLFSTNRFDLVIINVDGEVNQGFELASELRASDSESRNTGGVRAGAGRCGGAGAMHPASRAPTSSPSPSSHLSWA